MNELKLIELIKEALNNAIGDSINEDDNKERASIWVEKLANQFRLHYNKSKDNVEVFSRKYEDKRRSSERKFLLNELLFDIHVCEISSCKSANNKHTLCFPSKSLWQIESELSINSRETMKDFSKLVCGSADYKLFISSKKCKNHTGAWEEAAKYCSGKIYVALIPHPKDWPNDSSLEFFTYPMNKFKKL